MHACDQGELYRSLMRVALKQQDEIKLIIQEAIVSEEESVLQCAANFQFTGLSVLVAVIKASDHPCSLVYSCSKLIGGVV